MRPPDELRVKVKEMLDDLAAQADAYKLEPRLQLAKPYQFTSRNPAQRRDNANNKLPAGIELIQLGIVSFSKDRSLASVVVSAANGSRWHVFKRAENGSLPFLKPQDWEEQSWSGCGAIFSRVACAPQDV